MYKHRGNSVKTTGEPKAIRDIVDELYRLYGMKGVQDEHRALETWDIVVGDTIAKMTEIERIVNGILYVKVQNPSWRNELRFRKAHISKRLNEAIGKNMVKDIVFK